DSRQHTTTGEEKPMSYIKINAPLETGFGTVLSEPALTFIATLHDEFAGTISQLLRTRRARAAEMNGGTLPRFKPETARIRADRSPTVAVSDGVTGLEERRGQRAGDVTEPEVVSALNSQSKVWLADLEDATSPT